MRKKILWCGLAMCFVGCAGNKDLLSASISEAEGMGRAAKTEKIQSAAVVQGDSELAIARQLAEEGKSDAVWDAAERNRFGGFICGAGIKGRRGIAKMVSERAGK